MNHLPIRRASNHVKIVVNEGLVTLEELHQALDIAIKRAAIDTGACSNCGLGGFDLSFLRGDPVFARQLQEVKNIQAGMVEYGFAN